MKRTTAPALVLAPFVFVGCHEPVARPTRNPSLPVETKGAATAGSAACVVEGPGDSFTGEYLVHAVPELDAPILRVARAGEVRARITLDADRPVAAVTLLLPTLELSGFVARDELHFVTRERLSLDGSQLFLERGRLVTVRGVKGDHVTADVPTPFQKAPTSIQISCENLDYDAGGGGPLPSGTVGWAAQRASGPIAFFDEPRGRVVLRAETAAPMRVLETRDGFSHVTIGDAQPWCYQGVVADVWVASSELSAREPPPDIDDACFAILDSTDRCPAATIAKRTELWLGDPKQPASDLRHIGWLKQGAEVQQAGKARDHFMAITLNDDRVSAPPGLAFFADRTMITGDCPASGPDDGCPCQTD